MKSRVVAFLPAAPASGKFINLDDRFRAQQTFRLTEGVVKDDFLKGRREELRTLRKLRSDNKKKRGEEEERDEEDLALEREVEALVRMVDDPVAQQKDFEERQEGAWRAHNVKHSLALA